MSTLCLLSGGLDSAVMMASLIDAGEECRAVTFDYGQRHSKEIESAKIIASYYGIETTIVKTPSLRGSPLTDGVIGHGAPIVPNRNMVLVSIAASIAVASGHERVAIGCNKDDSQDFPDCREEYLLSLERALWIAASVRLTYPLHCLSKRGVVQLGVRLGVPMNLTWSCYKGHTEECGECLACKSKRSAWSY